MEEPTLSRETAGHGYKKVFTPLGPTRIKVRALWGMGREESPSSVNNVHKPFEGEGKQREMLLLRMWEAEAQICNNALEIEENQGLLPRHSRGEGPRLALGREICSGTRQTELRSHYWVAATLALLCVSGMTLLVGIDFCMYTTSECLSKTNYFGKQNILCSLQDICGFKYICICLPVFICCMSIYRWGKKEIPDIWVKYGSVAKHLFWIMKTFRIEKGNIF